MWSLYYSTYLSTVSDYARWWLWLTFIDQEEIIQLMRQPIKFSCGAPYIYSFIMYVRT